MDFVQMCLLLAGFIFLLLFIGFIEGLLMAAGRPTPSPLDRVADYSEEEDDLELNWCVIEGGKK